MKHILYNMILFTICFYDYSPWTVRKSKTEHAYESNIPRTAADTSTGVYDDLFQDGYEIPEMHSHNQQDAYEQVAPRSPQYVNTNTYREITDDGYETPNVKNTAPNNENEHVRVLVWTCWCSYWIKHIR